MGKRKETNDRYGDTKILYKKSNTSILYSRTCSGASQSTRSGILQIKKNISQHRMYQDKGKLKKDFSIETDICVLRRYFIEQRNKLPNQAASAKSKYSNYSALDHIAEFNHDDSACGDSSHSEIQPQFNLDLTTVMLYNFKSLLNSWFQKHLPEDNSTKKKLENTVNSILRKIESKRKYNLPSFSYFMRNRDNQRLELKTKQIDTSSPSENRQFFEKSLNTSTIECKDRSIHSIPISYRKLTVISTLSLPRNFPKPKTIYKRKKDKSRIDTKDKKFLISIYKPSKILTDCSSCNLLQMSTKSLIRRCTNFKGIESVRSKPKEGHKKRLTIVLEPSFRNTFISTSPLDMNMLGIEPLENPLISNAFIEKPKETKKNTEIMREQSFKSAIISTSSLEREPKTEYSKDIDLKVQTRIKKNAFSNAYLGRTKIQKSNETFLQQSKTNDFASEYISPDKNLTIGDKSCNEDLDITETSLIIDDLSITSVNLHRGNTYNYACSNACIETARVFDTIQSKSFVKIDIIDQRTQSIKNTSKINKDSKDTVKNVETIQKKRNVLKNRIRKRRKHPINKSLSYTPKFETIQYKDFTYLYKKVDNQMHENSDFLNHFKDIFKYFSNYEGDRNITLDIHVNVFPMLENGVEKIASITLENAEHDLKPSDIKTSPRVVYNVEPTSNLYNTSLDIGDSSYKDSTTYSFSYQKKIIPLLDGAASQAKYVFNKENPILKYDDQVRKLYKMTDRSAMTFDFEIVQEIWDLKAAIKDLATTTERLAIEHLNREKKMNERSRKLVDTKTSTKISMKIKSTQCSKSSKIVKKSNHFSGFNASRGIQISSKFRKNIETGFKFELRKESKKKFTVASEIKPFREDPSYRVIESETILKVTDMTSVGNNKTTEKTTDKALTCSLPPSKSLFEMSTTENNNTEKPNFCAYYCDGHNRKPGDFIIISPCPSQDCKNKNKIKISTKKEKIKLVSKKHKKETGDEKKILNEEPSSSMLNIGDSEHFTVKCYDCNREFSCSSVRLNIDSEPHRIKVKNKRVITTIEGYVYCIVLWILVIILFYFLYTNIGKQNVNSATTPRNHIETTVTEPTQEPTELNYQVKDNKMQTYIENESDRKKEFSKRPKSGTRFPKRMPSYVVAFSLGETLDDPPTLLQDRMGPPTTQEFCEKSPQGSFMSISSGDSTKTITNSDSIQDMCHIVDIPVTTYDTIIDMIDPIKYEDDDDGKKPDTNFYIIENNIADNNLNTQPQILYDSTKQGKISKVTTKKRVKNMNRKVKIRNFIYFKNKKNALSKKIYRYCLNSKKSNLNSAYIHKELYSNSLSLVVSRHRIVKKALAKENLFDGPNQTLTSETELKRNSIEIESITSTPSAGEKSTCQSDSNRSNLLKKQSTESRPDDTYCIATNSSVTEVPSNYMSPFQTNLKVAVAVTYTPTLTALTATNMDRVNIDNNNFNTFKESLTSTETVVGRTETLTSTPSAASKDGKEEYVHAINLNQSNVISVQTLVAKQLSMSAISSDYDSFVIAQTSSDFSKSSQDTTYSTNTNYEQVVQTINLNPILIDKKPILTETVYRGFITDSTPTNSRDNSYVNKVDVVAPGKQKMLLNKTNKYDEKTGVLNKIFIENLKQVNTQKTINLPNGSAIKAMIEEKATKILYPDEPKTIYPSSLPELLDRVMFVIDLAMKRLEVKLTEKIVREIRKISNSDLRPQREESKQSLAHKTIHVTIDDTKNDPSKCLQCDLVQNTIIDKLMDKLSLDKPKCIMSSSSTEPDVKLKEPELLKDYFEILKPPLTKQPENGVCLEETITTSTVSPDTGVDVKDVNLLKMCAIQTFRFIQQNLLVLSSFPTFLILLVFAYTSIALLFKF